MSEERVEEVFDLVKDSDLDTEVKQGFSQRRVEFLEDFSGDIAKIMAAQENHTKLYKGKSALVPLAGRKRSQDGERYASSNCDLIKLNTKTLAVLAISLNFILKAPISLVEVPVLWPFHLFWLPKGNSIL